MSEHSELKRLAEDLLASDDHANLSGWVAAFDAFEDASGPDVVLELLSEINQQRAEIAGLKTGYAAHEEEAKRLRGEVEALRKAAMPLDREMGDQLPAIGSRVLIHLGRSDAWVEHTVVGYYAWSDLGGNQSLHRVFVRVRDADGYLNSRLLKDVRIQPAMSNEACHE